MAKKKLKKAHGSKKIFDTVENLLAEVVPKNKKPKKKKKM